MEREKRNEMVMKLVTGSLMITAGIITSLIIGGCVTTNVKAEPERVIRIKVDAPAAEVKQDKKGENISRSMEVVNTDLQLSPNCRILNKDAYITMTSISSYNSEDLWKDFKVIGSRGIKKVIMYLNSPGGAAFQGMSITDEMRLLKASGIHITVEGRGLIASAAIPVFLMADRRVASKNTIFLIHPAALEKWGIFTETLKDLQSQAKMITLLQENYAASVAECSRISKDKALEFMKSDHWFTAEEARALGFVDEIK